MIMLNNSWRIYNIAISCIFILLNYWFWWYEIENDDNILSLHLKSIIIEAEFRSRQSFKLYICVSDLTMYVSVNVIFNH